LYSLTPVYVFYMWKKNNVQSTKYFALIFSWVWFLPETRSWKFYTTYSGAVKRSNVSKWSNRLTIFLTPTARLDDDCLECAHREVLLVIHFIFMKLFEALLLGRSQFSCYIVILWYCVIFRQLSLYSCNYGNSIVWYPTLRGQPVFTCAVGVTLDVPRSFLVSPNIVAVWMIRSE